MFQLAASTLNRVLLAFLLLACNVCWAAQAEAAPPPKGSLVIIGGALRGDNTAVWERMVQLAGGKGARIAVFASASASPDDDGARRA